MLYLAFTCYWGQGVLQGVLTDFPGISMVLHGCYKSVTRVLCYMGVSRMFQGFFKGVTRVLPGVFWWCNKGVTRVLQECYKGVTFVFQGCLKGFQGCYKGVEWMLNWWSIDVTYVCNYFISRIFIFTTDPVCNSILVTWYLLHNRGSLILVTRYLLIKLFTGYLLHDTCYSIFVTWYVLLDTFYLIFITCYLILVT